MPCVYLNEWPKTSPQDLARKENVLVSAKLMLNAAFSAPVMGGIPQVEAALVYGEDEQEGIARKMEEIALLNESPRLREVFRTEAVMVREADSIVLIGNYRAYDTPLDAGCGLCSAAPNCNFLYDKRKTIAGIIDPVESPRPDSPEEAHFRGPLCMCRVSDMGEAVGSALLVANSLLVDAKPMLSVGLAAVKLGYLKRSEVAVGIPVAAQAKNPFVDTLPNYHAFSLDKVIDNIRRTYPTLRQVYWYDYKTGFLAKKGSSGNPKLDGSDSD
jgi:uncharacterized ferredoxin-like protein